MSFEVDRLDRKVRGLEQELLETVASSANTETKLRNDIAGLADRVLELEQVIAALVMGMADLGKGLGVSFSLEEEEHLVTLRQRFQK